MPIDPATAMAMLNMASKVMGGNKKKKETVTKEPQFKKHVRGAPLYMGNSMK